MRMEKQYESLKQLFQQEFSKMVAVISKLYGLQHIEIAEDLVSETFLAAAETWGIKGIPPNPAAWLYTVAKQKTLYYFRRNKILDEKVIPALKVNQTATTEMEELDFSNQNIKDSQLQMLFAVCTPAIASEAQIGLALRILCGFGIDEIAEAFLSNKETINKRLFRAKEKLRTEHIKMEMPPEEEISGRLDNVLHVIYLLFSEGYYSQTQNEILRKDFCLEAMRLALLLAAVDGGGDCREVLRRRRLSLVSSAPFGTSGAVQLAQEALHGADLSGLSLLDLAGQSDRVRVLPVGLFGLRHLDRPLVVGNHHGEEHLVELGAGGVREVVHVVAAHHAGHRP